MSEYLLLEFVKIFNWTEKTPELRVVATLTNNAQILLDKTVKGEMQEDSLRFRLSLRVQMGRPGQNLRVQMMNGLGRSLGTAELSLQSGVLKHKIHYLSIPNSQNKILQVNVSADIETKSPKKKDLSTQCDRVVQQTMERKIMTNIQLKRNDLFIQNREKFLTSYSRSRSKSQTKDFPAKINSLLQQVRQIKNAIRLSNSRSNSRIEVRESNVTPSRLSSLQSIEQRTKLFQRSPREVKELPKRSPRRFQSDRCKFVHLSPDLYNQYGMRRNGNGNGNGTEHKSGIENRARENQFDRPSYLIRKDQW